MTDTQFVAQIKGRRAYQEDFVVYTQIKKPNFLEGRLLAVCDGHGGSEVAEIASNLLPELLNDYRGHDIPRALRAVISEVEQTTRLYGSGSTLSVAFIHADMSRVTTAVLGDSPIIVRDADGNLHTSVEHNAITNEAERQKIFERGGWFDGMYVRAPGTSSGLQLTRALGDFSLASVLDREPDITSYEIGPESFVAVCSDGIFEQNTYVSREDMLNGLCMAIDGNIPAADILALRAKYGVNDNVSLVYWRA